MDCRMSLLAALVLALGSGCVSTQQSAPTAINPSEATARVVVQKPKEGPKRPPLPGTVVSLALIKEREGDKAKDAAEQMKLYDEARQYYQEALRIDSTYRDAIQGLARVYSRMNDYEHAFDTYRKALDKTPKDHGMWFDMGMCYNRKKDLAQAIGCFQKALELDLENRQYRITLGFTLARAGQTEQGLALLTRALGSAMAHYNMARLMHHMGNADQCRHHLHLALQTNPGLEQARDMLAALEGPGAAQ
jgi:tetratricopeptide (TPR) repeat protein